jgi:hypothetical protein
MLSDIGIGTNCVIASTHSRKQGGFTTRVVVKLALQTEGQLLRCTAINLQIKGTCAALVVAAIADGIVISTQFLV